MNQEPKLLSQCCNVEVIGHPNNPSGDPTRCTECGEICGTFEDYMCVPVTSPEELTPEARAELKIPQTWEERFAEKKKEWEAKGYDLLWEDIQSFIQSELDKARKEGRIEGIKSVNDAMNKKLEEIVKKEI